MCKVLLTMSVQSTDVFKLSGLSNFTDVFGSPTVAVTGAAGFIGSHLVERLLTLGCSVIGIDDFDPWYDPLQKRTNLLDARKHPNFELVEASLDIDVAHEIFDRASVVFHLAGRPGVQDSWGEGFVDSSRRNIELTQRVYEASVACGVSRVVYTSSSSVYGADATGLDVPPQSRPISPYGVSKLAGEQLAHVYRAQGLNVTNLRYFTVYGPRQRPDMAMHRMFEATRIGGPVFLRRGSGRQRREFTYVQDVVEATAAAGFIGEAANKTFDIGGGSSVSLEEVMALVETVAGSPMQMRCVTAPTGDPMATVARTEQAVEVLGWRPQVGLEEGLYRQWNWHRQCLESEASILVAD